MEMINPTPLTVSPLFMTDRHGADTLVAVVKATWRIDRDGTLSLAEEQVPIYLEPAYHGEPGASSLLHDTDAVLVKPGTDCILLGHAWAPRVGVNSVDVSLAVGPVRRTVRVFGERCWVRRLWTTSASRPEPFESIALLWERSFGGADLSSPDPAGHEVCLENPVGRGLLARKTKLEIDGMRLPNLEDPACPIEKPRDRPRPMGFGPVPPYWQPRAGYAGTYDDRWRNDDSPLPPQDLDPRFYASAPHGLTTLRYLSGAEEVLIQNAAKAGRLRFELPGVTPRVTVRLGTGEKELSMNLDTVIVEPDEARLVQVWRGNCAVHGRVHEVGRLAVGPLRK